jgi:lysozyme
MTINKAGIDLIKKWEGFRAETYRCSAGILSIGYGTTKAAGVGIDPQPGMRISEPKAEELLRITVDKFAAAIRPAITAPINDNEFAAFVSLAYNIGPGAFRKSSALRHFNQGNKAKAADAILLWNKAGGRVLKGLQNRRAEERALFLAPVAVEHKTQKRSPQIGVGALVAAIMAGLGLWLADLFEPIRNLFGG